MLLACAIHHLKALTPREKHERHSTTASRVLQFYFMIACAIAGNNRTRELSQATKVFATKHRQQ